MADFEDLVATKLANKIEKDFNNRLNEVLKGDLATGYLNQKQLCKYLGISPTTFKEKIKPLAPPTFVIDGMVRYKVESIDQWMKQFEIWNDEYIPERSRA
jgi:hypothetical protein